MPDPAYREITPTELAEQLAADDPPRVIDVREPHEWEVVRLEAAELKPLSEIRQWWTELDPSEEIVFHCHHGQRSASVCSALAAEGFSRLINLRGGIDAWAAEVAPDMPRY